MSEYNKDELIVSSMSTDEDPRIRDSAKDLLQLSIVERERRVDTSIESATKNTMVSPFYTGDAQIKEIASVIGGYREATPVPL